MLSKDKNNNRVIEIFTNGSLEGIKWGLNTGNDKKTKLEIITSLDSVGNAMIVESSYNKYLAKY